MLNLREIKSKTYCVRSQGWDLDSIRASEMDCHRNGHER